MIKFKSCPKCQGDFYLSEDQYGKYFKCMQCGNIKDIIDPEPVKSVKPYVAREKELEAA